MKALILLPLLAFPCFGASKAPYHQKADKIVHILKREGARPNREAIALTLKAIDVNLKRYFPKGPFNATDWYAIGMLESRFDPTCVGSVAGERGIFQIRPEYHKGNDLHKIPVNTELAFKIMRSKLREHHGDKRKAIVGFNGYRVRNGKLLDGYYLAFQKQRKRVQHV